MVSLSTMGISLTLKHFTILFNEVDTLRRVSGRRTPHSSIFLALILGLFFFSCEKESLEITDDSLLVNIESRSRSSE